MCGSKTTGYKAINLLHQFCAFQALTRANVFQVYLVVWHITVLSGFIMALLDLIKKKASFFSASKTANLVMSLSETIWAPAVILSVPRKVGKGFKAGGQVCYF